MTKTLFFGVLFWNGLILLASAESCDRKSSCSCECSEGIVDISALGTKNGPRYKDLTAFDQYQYSYNPCDPFTETEIPTFEDHCQNVADSAEFYTKNGQDVGLVDVDQVVIAKYTSADKARQTEVILVCNNDDEKTAFDTFGEVPNPTPLYRFVLVSPLCCFYPASGLSVGSILLITAFTIAAVYLIGGVVVKRFRYQSSGRDLLPNTEFWLSLPSLIKDGCLLVIKRGDYQAIK
ncbi:hypothetical protein ACF0H5_018105 [Mactra antiquata]